MSDYILVLNEGTTSTRAMLFASDGASGGKARRRTDAALSKADGLSMTRRNLGKTLACANEVIWRAAQR
jgi:glycerol kinase